MKVKTCLISIVILLLFTFFTYHVVTRANLNSNFKVGHVVDSLDGVAIYFNGGVNNVVERNLTKDGYNLGLKYQCVEFVKRYYFEYFNHRMPDSYGHAKDFFDKDLGNGSFNTKRDLFQFTNGQGELPKRGDLLVFKPTIFNRYGHVAIVSVVDTDAMTVEIAQQNPGPFSDSRESYVLLKEQNTWSIENNRVLGWLRK